MKSICLYILFSYSSISCGIHADFVFIISKIRLMYSNKILYIQSILIIINKLVIN